MVEMPEGLQMLFGILYFHALAFEIFMQFLNGLKNRLHLVDDEIGQIIFIGLSKKE